MRLTKIGFVFLSLSVVLLVTVGFANAAPQAAISLVEGRNYDQAHDTGYIDWSGSVGYVYMTHRDFTSLPPEEGGVSCASGCQEWVTRIRNGGTVRGSFDRDVSYFEVMVGFTHDGSVGSATVRACGSVRTSNLYLGPGGGLPGFVSMSLAVPAGCQSWSLSASGGYVDFRSVDVNYVVIPPTVMFTLSSTPTTTATFTPTPTSTLTSTSSITNTPTQTYTPTLTDTPTTTITASQTATNTVTLTFTPSATWTSWPTFTLTDTPTPSPSDIATFPSTPPRVSISDRWWIWESGELKVFPGSLPIKRIEIRISDNQLRWQTVIREYTGNKAPDAISWNRRFADGILAPPGEYDVDVIVCDLDGRCGRDTGLIIIPHLPTATATDIPYPTVTSTETPIPTVSSPATPTLKLPTPPVTSIAVDAVEEQPEKIPPAYRSVVAWFMLVLIFTTTSLVDPRPKALRRLKDALNLIFEQNIFSKDDN